MESAKAPNCLRNAESLDMSMMLSCIPTTKADGSGLVLTLGAFTILQNSKNPHMTKQIREPLLEVVVWICLAIILLSVIVTVIRT